MKRIIIFLIMLVVLSSFISANDEGITGYIWYDKFDSITEWDWVTVVSDPSLEFQVYNDGGENRMKDFTAGASGIELDNAFIFNGTDFTIEYNISEQTTTQYNYLILGSISTWSWTDTAGNDAKVRTSYGAQKDSDLDVDIVSGNWYTYTWYIHEDFIEWYIDDVLIVNHSYTTGGADLTLLDDNILIRTDGDNVLYDDFKIWYGRPSDEPIGGSPPPSTDNNLSISLNYPVNGTLYYGDYTGVINISLTNVNGTANCGINNDTRWTVQGSDFGNETVLFYNNTAIIETNVSVQIDCWDIDSYYNYTGVWFSKYNILNVSIFDDVTGDLINVTVDMTLYNDFYYNSSYTTNNGSIYIIGLANGTYTAEFSSDNYSNREYSATLGYGETTNLNAYLSVVDGYVVFTTRDRETGAVIQGATVTIKKYIDGILTTIYVKETDITGRIQFGYGEGIEYYFTITKTGYEDKSFILDPIIFNEYNIYLDSTAEIEDNTDFAGVSISHNPTLFYEGNNNLTVTISNPDGALLSYGFNVSYLSNLTTLSGVNAYGSSFNENIIINGSSWGDMLYLTIYYTLNGGSQKTFSYNYEIVPEASNNTFLYNQEKTYGLGELERVSIFTLIILFIGGMFTIFTGVIGGLGMGLLLMGYFVKIGFISLWYVIIPLFAGSIILIWRASQ